MILRYTFIKNCKEYKYEYEIKYSEAFDLIKDYLEYDGYDVYETDEEIIDEYIDMYISDIKDYFYDQAYQEWEESLMSPYEYYGLNEDDYH